jgi:hypothetical protein
LNSATLDGGSWRLFLLPTLRVVLGAALLAQ